MNKELKKAAEAFFKNYEGEKEAYGTPDGNMWFERQKHLAYDHARKTGQECYKVTPADLTDKGDGAAGKTPAASKSSTSKNSSNKTVKQILEEAGIKPEDVKGTGPGGIVTKADAAKAIEAKAAQDKKPAEVTPVVNPDEKPAPDAGNGKTETSE
jgi:pyruvate/2-oxoglutarate dehydrogenase complex dihydrolipoamide acyltransferase (E2) component